MAKIILPKQSNISKLAAPNLFGNSANQRSFQAAFISLNHSEIDSHTSEKFMI